MCYFIFAAAYLIDPIAFFYGCFKYLKPKFQKRFLYIIPGIGFYGILMMKQWVLTQDNLNILAAILFPLIILVMYTMERVLFLGRQKNEIMLIAVMLLVSIAIDGLVFIILLTLRIPYRETAGFTVKSAAVTLAARVASFIIYITIFRYAFTDALQKKMNGIKSVCFYGILSIAFFVVTVCYIGNKNHALTYFVLGMHIILTVFFSCFICKIIIERNQSELEAINRAELIEQQMAIMEHAKDISGELKSLRHDTRSHLLLIKELMKQEKYELLNRYMEELCAEIELAEEICLCENYVLSVIISNKAKTANKLGIKFSHNITVMDFPLFDYELNSLCSNILNNAFEAVQKVPQEKGRLVDLEIKQNELKNIVITCTNTIAKIPSKDSNKHICTTKGDTKKHGIGLKTIKKLVKKNGGFIEINYDNFCFSIVVVLIQCNHETKEGI